MPYAEFEHLLNMRYCGLHATNYVSQRSVMHLHTSPGIPGGVLSNA